MKKIKVIRIILLLTPLIFVGFLLYENYTWTPPLDPKITQPVFVNTLLENPDVYKAPMLLVINGQVKNLTSGDLFLSGLFDTVLRINCSLVNINAVQPGDTLYIKGYSYIHDSGKNYLLAVEIYIFESYSLYLSIPGLIIILLLLFIVFKFKLRDFSFSRKSNEEKKSA